MALKEHHLGNFWVVMNYIIKPAGNESSTQQTVASTTRSTETKLQANSGVSITALKPLC